jgi:hypothetical protein
MHACAAMPKGGELLVETADADVPFPRHSGSYSLLSISYSADEPEPDRLFEPSATDEGLALSMVHTIVAEHGGFISAQAIATGGCRFELLLPQQADPAHLAHPPVHGVPSILLVDDRDRIRLHLHNFFEANGYNLLEAVDEAEAVAIGQLHENELDLLIAEAAQADTIAQGMGGGRMRLLRIVDRPEGGPEEIRRPFSQQALLQKVEALLRPLQGLESAAAT